MIKKTPKGLKEEPGYHKDMVELLYRALKRVVNNLNPLAVWLMPESMSDLIGCWFEYYRGPFYFCIEPELGDDDIGMVETACKFFYDENIREEIEEIRRILPKNELLRIIEENSDAIIRGEEEGIGVIRNNPDFFDAYIRPRYFIRKELRRSGVELKPGRTEEMILEGLRIRPDALKYIGLVDEEFYRRIEEARRRVEESMRELLVSTGKYERNLLEKYEELNRKRNEYRERTGKDDEELWKEWKRFVYLRSAYLDEFNKEYKKELEKVILEMLPEDMLKDLGFE